MLPTSAPPASSAVYSVVLHTHYLDIVSELSVISARTNKRPSCCPAFCLLLFADYLREIGT